MGTPVDLPDQEMERFRAYLRLPARMQPDPHLQGKLDPSARSGAPQVTPFLPAGQD